jgi:hypothetical protein
MEEYRPMHLDSGDSVVATRTLGTARTGYVDRGTDGVVVQRDRDDLRTEDTYTVAFISHGFLGDTETTLSRLKESDLLKR